MARGILVLQPGTEPTFPCIGSIVLTIGPPGMSFLNLLKIILIEVQYIYKRVQKKEYKSPKYSI